MFNPALAAFGNAVQASPEHRDRVAAILAAPEAERPALLIAFSEQIGHPVSLEDFATLANQPLPSDELSAGDLENVSGGLSAQQIESIGIAIRDYGKGLVVLVQDYANYLLNPPPPSKAAHIVVKMPH